MWGTFDDQGASGKNLGTEEGGKKIRRKNKVLIV